MPKAEIGSGNLRVLIYGQPGSGKTHTWLKMVKDNPDSTFHVIDVDAGVNETIAGFPKKDRDEMLKRINYYLCDSWNDVMASFEDIRKVLRPTDWIIMEQLGQLWDLVQEHYTKEVFGSDLGEYYAQMRQEMIKRKKSGADAQARLDGWKDWCMPLDTLIMTAEGWKKYDQIRPGDNVLTLNTGTGRTMFESLLDIYVGEPKERELYSIKGRNHDSVSTDGHRWAVIRGPTSTRGISERRHLTLEELVKNKITVRTSDCLKTYDKIPISAEYDGFPTKAAYTDAFVELIAWFWTEGDFIKKGTDGFSTGHIAQKDETKVRRIRKALNEEYGIGGEMGYKGKTGKVWNEHTRKDGVTIFTLSKKIVSKFLMVAPNKVPTPAFVRSMTKTQLSEFIQVSVLADGSVNPKTGQITWTQADKNRVDIFEMTCALAGIATGTTEKRLSSWGKKHKYNVTLLKRSVVQPTRITTFKEKIPVWCPSTPSGTWLAKRGSTPFFTGNSIIKKMHNQDFLETLTKRLICKGVILTSATKELDDNPMYENADVIDIFKKIGFKPEGEKHNIFRVDAMLFITKDKSGQRWVKSPKARGMEEFSEVIPAGDTAIDVYFRKRAKRIEMMGESSPIHPKKVEKPDKVAEELFA